MSSRKDRDYYFDMAINAVKEYVKKKNGIEWTGQDRPKYMHILKNDEKFHVFACFRYGLIDYDINTDKLEINEVKNADGRRLFSRTFIPTDVRLSILECLEESGLINVGSGGDHPDR